MKPFMTIQQLKTLIKDKKISVQEIQTFYKNRLEKYNKTLNVALQIFDKPVGSKDDGLLTGIPGILKNNISIEGKKTTCASKMLENYTAPYNATIVDRLKASGASIIGAANMDEFAMGASGEFSAFGATKNPWNLKHTPGGSSSGSAAAVAAGLVPWAIGTETGGSVRQPASFTGLVGLYPTYGLFSRYGIVAYASSTDQPGPLTKTVYDNALVASAMTGHDPKDSTNLPEPKRDFTKNLDGALPENFTIGVIQDSLEFDGVNSEVKTSFKTAIHQMEKLGAKIKYITLPNMKYGISIYFILTYAEAASNLARFDGSLYGLRIADAANLRDMYVKTRDQGFGHEVKRRILVGNFALSAEHRKKYFAKANKIRNAIRSEFTDAFKNVNVLMSPTTATPAFKLGQFNQDPVAMYLNDYFTIPNCMAGIPALSIPCGFTKKGMPIGFQFIGPRLSESMLYKVAYAYEQSTEWHTQTPKGFE